MAIIASALARIKSDPLACLGGAQRVNQCFAAVGHVWRERVLNPANTMALFILQVLHGNTAIDHLRMLWKVACASGSYCDARSRLPVSGVAAVVEQLSCDAARRSDPASTWMGRRVLMTDASTAATPDTPDLQRLWPQPSAQKPGCGFPLVKLLALMDLATGMILHLTFMCLGTHEMSQLLGLHGVLRPGDVLLGDRAFCSFAHLAMLAKMSADAVFRMHQRQIVDFTPHRPCRRKTNRKKRRPKKNQGRGMPSSRFIKKLGEGDQLVEWPRPDRRPPWMTEAQFAAQPNVLRVRELRYRIATPGLRTRQITIATTLLDAMRYPKREIARLYGLRWEIETNFRHLKSTMGMEHLKCQTAQGVLKELMVFALVYNLIRAVMTQAAARQRVADANRMSFVDALRLVRCLLTGLRIGQVTGLIVNPIRPGRYHPRVLKRRIKPYDLMNKPRGQYSQPSAQEDIAA
jgi:hypothetical protein